MAWTLVASEDPEMSLLATGSIEWNTATQVLLGDPRWVDLLWEPDERWLGIRCNYVTDGLPVYPEPDISNYMIDSDHMLDAAGISVDENYTAAPVRTPEPLVGPEGGLYSSEPVWYIIIPE